MEIEPADSVSNHDSHAPANQFPDFKMRNGNRADKTMEDTRAFHNDEGRDFNFYGNKQTEESERDLRSRDMESGVKSVTTQLASHNLNNQLKSLSTRNHWSNDRSHSNSRDNKYTDISKFPND